MNKRNSSSRRRSNTHGQKTRKKREELSVSATKSIKQENVEIAIDIEQRVRQSAGILTEVMLEGGGLEINDGEAENEDLATAGLPKELPIEK